MAEPIRGEAVAWRCVRDVRDTEPLIVQDGKLADDLARLGWIVTPLVPALPESPPAAPRPRIVQTEDGPMDLGEEYEAVYHLADVIGDVLDIEAGDALDEALALFAKFPDGPAAPAVSVEERGVLGWVVLWWEGGKIIDSSGVFWSPPDAEVRVRAEAKELARLWKGSGRTFTVEPVGAPPGPLGSVQQPSEGEVSHG